MYKPVIRAIFTFSVVTMIAASASGQGIITPTNAPAPSMHTLDEIYRKVENLAPQDLQTLSDTTTLVPAGYYAETTLKAVDHDLAAGNIKDGVTIFGITGILEIPSTAPVPKTGQKTSYLANDDGALEKGMAWPYPRFTDNGDGTVTDNLTGLIWLKNANAFGATDWAMALTECAGLQNGQHGLSDGSIGGDWRLPNVREMLSLVDYGRHDPCLCDTAGTGDWTSGDPFTEVQTTTYWTSTTLKKNTTTALFVTFSSGFIQSGNKDSTFRFVWPVRGGE